jgi:hypothetical protein
MINVAVLVNLMANIRPKSVRILTEPCNLRTAVIQRQHAVAAHSTN